ncbi:MAG: livF [Burkholderia sp.]|jgi:branched-chain amino acid transport system ATP-binding protein|nr:livF [Burkholderia sp.]
MLLEIEHLSASYGKATALEDITMHVDAGELVAVLGPNGAGKTTLLKAISRSVAGQGRLDFDGASLNGLPAHAVVGRGICHCPEGRRLFTELTVKKNLLLGAYLRNDRLAIERDYQRVVELFPILRERASQIVSTLSGGQQQMVAIGRALMGAPKLLLLDEPSVGIAHRLKVEIFSAIRAIRESGVAILMAEQDAQSALRIADRVYVLEHGRVAQSGTAAEMAGDNRIRQIYLGVA